MVYGVMLTFDSAVDHLFCENVSANKERFFCSTFPMTFFEAARMISAMAISPSLVYLIKKASMTPLTIK
jgi:hypothetical protein